MSDSRRAEILRAEESVRALAGELASAQESRHLHEQAASALQESLQEVKIASAGMQSVHDLIQEEMKTYRAEIKSATDDLGVATDFAHERLKQTAGSLHAISMSLEGELTAVRQSVTELENRISQQELTTRATESEIGAARESIAVLDTRISQQARILKMIIGAIVVANGILLLAILLI